MSIKIHHGYRIADGTDLFAFADLLRETMNPIRDRLDAALLMRAAVAAVDHADTTGQPRPADPLTQALFDHDEQQARLKPTQHGHDPHRFEVAFGRDRDTGTVVALLYTDHRAFVAAWEALPQVTPFAYWNNTDRPEEVTDADWEARGALWARLLPDGAPPVAHTLGFALRSSMADPRALRLVRLWAPVEDPDRVALLREVAPTLRKRADTLALSMLNRQAHRRATDRGETPDPVRLFTRLARSRTTAAQTYEAVVEACQVALAEDVVDYVLTGAPRTGGDPPTRPLDLAAAQAAAAQHLDALDGLDRC